ncbi:MAG: glycosyltransferase [Casimicrobiaceae bacterium]
MPRSDAKQRTRLVFVSRTFPADFARSTYGIFIRMRMLLDSVRSLADDLDIVFYVDPEIAISESRRRETEDNIRTCWGIHASVTLAPESVVPPSGDAWAHYVWPLFSVYRQLDFAGTAHAAQARILERHVDSNVVAIVAHRLGAMWPVILGRAAWPPVFFDLDDVEHRKLARQLHGRPFHPGKLAEYLQVPALFLGELRAIRRARTTFVCSEVDRRYLAWFCRRDAIVVAPNAAAFPDEPPADPGVETLLYLGSFTYGPNVDAAEYLVAKLWPAIKRLRPRARLLVAGQRPERIPSHAAPPPDVVFTGFVADLGELYAQVRVVCCPIRTGGGTRIKIIEAAGYGRPVVATRVGAEGLEFADGKEICVTDSDAQFVTSCALLLGDAGRAQAMGAAARKRALVAYDRNAICARLRRVVAAGIGNAATAIAQR